MSQWARSHPDEMAEIAGLPPSRQNEALRGAMERGPEPSDEPRTSVYDKGRIVARRLAAELAEGATLAPGGVNWPSGFTLPDEHPVYAVTKFEGETVFAGGADVSGARDALIGLLLESARAE